MRIVKSRKKRIRRLKFICGILGIILLIFILIHVNEVNAGSKDSTLLKNRKEGVYAVTNLNGEKRLFYLNMYTMNGIPAYCIELGVDIDTDIYDSSTDYSSSGLSYSKAEYVQAISYFGYKYKGHEDYRYYMASQELIWEYLNNVQVEWTSEENFDGKRIDIDSYKNDIVNLINSYNNSISFDFDSKNIVPDKEYIVEDKNGVLSNYYVKNVYGLEVYIDGNNLMYSLKNKNMDNVSFRLKWRDYYNYSSKFYVSGNSQKLVSSGNFINKVYDASFSVVKSNLNLCVVDMDTKLSIGQGDALLKGAKYKIYRDNELVKEIVTDENGCASVSDLEMGEYYIKQDSASLGYIVNEKDVLVNLVSGNNDIILEEKVISNEIEIYKSFGSNDRIEEGVSFSIYNKNNQLVKNIVTDSDGVGVVVLPYGEYLLKQDNTTYGYRKVDEIRIVVDEMKEEVIKYDLNDEQILVGLRINTFVKDTLDKIKLCDVQYKILDNGSDKYFKYNDNDVFVANDNGEVYINGIGYGDYSLEQVKVCHGYVINEKKINFSVGSDSNISDDGYVEVNFYNEKIVGKINIHVQKELFLSGNNSFSYKIEDYGDVIVNIYQNDNLVDTIFMNKNGAGSISGLELGKYCVVYEKYKECVDVDTDKNDIAEIIKEVNIIVSLDKGSVILTNYDEDGNEISESLLELYDKNGKLLYTGSTSEEGIIKVSNLVVGEYCFKQKSVSLGFLLNNDKVCFKIKNNDDVEKIQIINRKKLFKGIVVPDTFSDNSCYFKLFFIILIVFGVVFYKKRVSI